jgi:hypothetical protein
MASEQAFRVAVYTSGVRVPSEVAWNKYLQVQLALRKILYPLRLGDRLSFEFQLAEDGLWAGVMIRCSSQLSLLDELQTVKGRSGEGEAAGAAELFLTAARRLRELMCQGRVHGATIETIQAEMARIQREELALAVEGPGSGNSAHIHVQTADSTLDIHLGSVPKRRMRLSEISVTFEVLSVSPEQASIRLEKTSMEVIGGISRTKELYWERVQPEHSDMADKLFRSMMCGKLRACTAFPFTNKAGEVAGLRLVDLHANPPSPG